MRADNEQRRLAAIMFTDMVGYKWMERARQQRDPGLGGMRSEPFYANLHGDPRWDAFLHKMGLADDQLK